MGTNLLLVLLALGLVLLNGFFVAAEFSLVKLRETRAEAIARKHGWRGRVLLNVHRNLDAYLSACQLGITLASLGLGWIGEPAFADLLRPGLLAMGIEREAVIHAIAFSTAFFIISYLHIVVGELAPKSMAIRRTEAVGTWTAAPLYAFYWLMYPVIWVLNHSSNWLLARFGLGITQNLDARYSAEELKMILRGARADDGFTPREWHVLAQAIDFRDLVVADLMRPFDEAITLSAGQSAESNIERIVQHRFSRYPYLDDAGRVMGVIHLKDLFLQMQKGEPLDNLDSLCRTVRVVPPSLSTAELLRRFQRGAPHFAVVAWDSARPLGFITLDNLLGALLGEIRDEFREVGNDWLELDDGSLLGKGSLPIFSLERALGLDIEAPDADSVAGLILERHRDIPREGERIEFDEFSAVVKKLKGPKILLVRIYPRSPSAEQDVQEQPAG